MAVKTISRYQTSDGSLFTNFREATKYQNNLNEKAEAEYSRKVFNEWLNKQLDVAKGEEPSDASKLILKIFSGQVRRQDSEEVLTEYFVKYGRDLNFLLANIVHSAGAKLPIRGVSAVLEVAKAD